MNWLGVFFFISVIWIVWSHASMRARLRMTEMILYNETIFQDKERRLGELAEEMGLGKAIRYLKTEDSEQQYAIFSERGTRVLGPMSLIKILRQLDPE